MEETVDEGLCLGELPDELTLVIRCEVYYPFIHHFHQICPNLSVSALNHRERWTAHCLRSLCDARAA